MPYHKISLAVGATLAAGGLLLGGSALANAASGSTSTSSSSSAYGEGRGSSDTPVTGSQAARVAAAVTAEDSSVTVTAVRKDPDGSFDVLGTEAGSQVMYDVSADLKTITLNTFHGGGPSDDQPSTSSSSTT